MNATQMMQQIERNSQADKKPFWVKRVAGVWFMHNNPNKVFKKISDNEWMAIDLELDIDKKFSTSREAKDFLLGK